MQTIQNTPPSRNERIDLSRLWWVGLLVIMASIVVNLLISNAVVAIFATLMMASGAIVFLTGIGALGAVLVFALVAWLAPHPINLYRIIAGAALLLSFVPDILLLTAGFPVVIFAAYILMHIATAAICVLGLTTFTKTREVVIA